MNKYLILLSIFFSQDVWAYLGYFLQPKSFLYNRSKYTINNDLLTSVHDFTFLNICVNDYKGSFENNLILEKIPNVALI